MKSIWPSLPVCPSKVSVLYSSNVYIVVKCQATWPTLQVCLDPWVLRASCLLRTHDLPLTYCLLRTYHLLLAYYVHIHCSVYMLRVIFTQLPNVLPRRIYMYVYMHMNDRCIFIYPHMYIHINDRC